MNGQYVRKLSVTRQVKKLSTVHPSAERKEELEGHTCLMAQPVYGSRAFFFPPPPTQPFKMGKIG